MKMPLIVDENGDASLYWSVTEAELSLEAIDVKNNEYVAYDSDGRRLDIDLVEPSTVKIGGGQQAIASAEELASILRRYIAARTEAVELSKFTLSELLTFIVEHKLKN